MRKVALAVLFMVLVGPLSSCKRHRVTSLPMEEQVILSTGTIGMNGSLSDSLGRFGVASTESAQVEKTLKPLFNPRYSKPNDRFEIARSTSGHFVRMAYWPNAYQYYTVLRSTMGVFSANAARIPMEETLAGVYGNIQVSLWEAMTSQGTPPEMIYRFADIFGWRVDFLTEPRAGDTYKMVWKRQVGSSVTKDGDIVCAMYEGKETGTVSAFLLASDYFDEKGDSLRGEFLRAPLAYRRISSKFTNSRFHPILRYWRPHHGIDYSAARGTPVVCIGDGVVIAKGYDGGLGNEIRVRHAGSYVSIYGHLMGYARGIHMGSSIRQGQLIGYVGSTGLSTGPHLHFGMERAGQLINFLTMKATLMRKHISPSEREHYKRIQADAQSYFALLDKSDEPVKTLKPLIPAPATKS